ncbi:hypothetical protein PR048_018590 [Dryococelus australis]|uniref:Uncharacterized protein n=1 Tax=Dryococelus australis TaxID=614101 RepID=A0ABQ9HCP9_9NEOP|nr:hypothetical protein PR048_018590 [Dryococelus australis]
MLGLDRCVPHQLSRLHCTSRNLAADDFTIAGYSNYGLATIVGLIVSLKAISLEMKPETCNSSETITNTLGATVAERLACSPPGSISARISPDFSMWESCQSMPFVGGFSRGSPVSLAPSFRRCSILISITPIGSQDLDVKSHPNLFTRSQIQTEVSRNSNPESPRRKPPRNQLCHGGEFFFPDAWTCSPRPGTHGTGKRPARVPERPVGPTLALHRAGPGPCLCVVHSTSPSIIRTGQAGPGLCSLPCVPGLIYARTSRVKSSPESEVTRAYEHWTGRARLV